MYKLDRISLEIGAMGRFVVEISYYLFFINLYYGYTTDFTSSALIKIYN